MSDYIKEILDELNVEVDRVATAKELLLEITSNWDKLSTKTQNKIINALFDE